MNDAPAPIPPLVRKAHLAAAAAGFIMSCTPRTGALLHPGCLQARWQRPRTRHRSRWAELGPLVELLTMLKRAGAERIITYAAAEIAATLL